MKQETTAVAIQGYVGSFHHIAAEAYFGNTIEILPQATFAEVFQSCDEQDAHCFALVAIENSIAGSIIANYELLEQSPLVVVGEVYLGIEQNLLALPGQKMTDLQEVHSHPMAIAQCRQFFARYPEIKLIASTDTALSAQEIKEESLWGCGAIASSRAAEIHGLDILAPGIETVKNNYTRFLVLSPLAKPADAHYNKSSLCFRLPHKAGALAAVLLSIAELGVNVSKIQSLPIINREWQYSFHLDMEFSESSQYEQALGQLQAVTEQLKVYGIYKKGQVI